MNCSRCFAKGDTTGFLINGLCNNCLNAPAPQVPFCCPVCNGAKKVSRPPWVAGDQLFWDGSGMTTYPCGACNETGVVWGPPAASISYSFSCSVVEMTRVNTGLGEMGATVQW